MILDWTDRVLRIPYQTIRIGRLAVSNPSGYLQIPELTVFSIVEVSGTGKGDLNDRSAGDVSDTRCTHLAHNDRQLTTEDVEDAFYTGLAERGETPQVWPADIPAHARRGLPARNFRNCRRFS